MNMMKKCVWFVSAFLAVPWSWGQTQWSGVIYPELLEQRRWPMEEGTPPGSGALREKNGEIPEEQLKELAAMSDSQIRAFIERHRSNLYERWGSLHRTLDNLILQGEAQTARRILLQLVADVDPRQPVELPLEGRKDQEAIDKINRYRNLAYEYTLLMLITGNHEYGEWAQEIVLEFSRVLPQWNFYFEGKTYAQDHERYRRNWRGRGLFGAWYPTDLYHGLTLLRTYDTLRPWFTEEEREQVEKNLFTHHKRSIDLFTGAWRDTPFHGEVSGFWRSYHNLMVYQLEGTIRYAQVLQRADWIHEIVRYYEEYLRYTYTPDGLYREVSIDYHTQITGGILGSIPRMLQGYSDPEGYVDPVSGKRFDNLDFAQWEALMQPIRESVRALVLPDGTFLNTNDAGPARRAVSPEQAEYGTQPALLGGAGVAKLGSRGMVAYLLYGGTRGHDHRNALNLFWYAGNREVFSGTGYRPLRDSGNTREWNTITPSHNTVMVDGQNHFQDRARLRIEQPTTSTTSQKPEIPGKEPVEAALAVAASYRDQGELLLWDAQSEQVQAMEAGQERAYPGLTSLFRRTLVMVPLAEGEGYLVDIFRVRGGQRHEFFLRGGLDQPYTLEFDLPMREQQETLYQYLQIEQRAPFNQGLTAQAAYPDGLRVISHIPIVHGSRLAQRELLVGTAPAIRRPGKATYSLIRQEIPESQAQLETVYVWVHETTSGESRVSGVRAHVEEDRVFIQIEREGVKDYVFSGLTEQSRFKYGKWQFQGRLAWVSLDEEEQITGKVFSGGPLSHDRETLPANLPMTGKILSTGSRFQGADTDFILVELSRKLPEGKVPHLAHLQLGEALSLSVPVTGIEQQDGQLKVKLAYSPGFDLGKDAIYMNYFPGWRIVGEPRIVLQF